MVLRNPWETTSKSGLVTIGSNSASHKLFLSTSGPARTPGSPVILFFTGGGAPCASHIRIQRLLSEFARVYFYDRAGYDLSDRNQEVPHPNTADAAAELDILLRAVRVGPPYILVGESYGSLIAREFLALHSSEAVSDAGSVVTGMVLVDSATELIFEVFPAIPPSSLAAIAEGVDFVGLTHLREESKLTDEEWQNAIEATQRTQPGSAAENKRGGSRPLARKRQFQMQALGNRPLSVIRCNSVKDYRLLYEEGVKMGNGTEEQRAEARNFIEVFDLFDDECRVAQLRLSGLSRYVHVADCGHDMPLRRPEVIAKEVRWVLQNLGS